jgi:plastocyanin
MRLRSRLIFLAVVPLMPGAAAMDGLVIVSQHNRSFSTSSLAIRVGTTIRFSNEDDFGHQIYIDSPSFSFDSDESYPGDHVDVTFPATGTFEVRCHIHPRMHLSVQVE